MPVRLLQVVGSLDDQILQMIAVSGQLLFRFLLFGDVQTDGDKYWIDLGPGKLDSHLHRINRSVFTLVMRLKDHQVVRPSAQRLQDRFKILACEIKLQIQRG